MPRTRPATTPPSAPAHTVALRLLGRRSYSRSELSTKLSDRGYDAAAVAQALALLAPYLDDQAFALGRIRYRVVYSKWGRVRIQRELQQKGIALQTIQAAFRAWEESPDNPHDWASQAQELLQRRFGRHPGPLSRNDYAKRINFLLRRGFDLSQAQAALQAVRTEED